ncbi:Poly(ADP-ribose) polymerase catalytic domain protein [compost metagenome]
MAAEGTDSKVMRPVFHGTGSVAASMILRYGFKVIKSSDSSVVGRMLGDGIYFSNVIDKVSQYMSDGGYSRGVGIKGYIFEMEASLGKYKRDYNAAGPGTGHDTTRVISPEWAVFNANDQIRIYKAYQCELIDKSAMDVLKAKQGVNETTSVIGIQHFKGFVNEALGDKMKNKVVYIFMDGTIPVSKHKSVDFEDFDPAKYGKHVQTDWSGSGPTVQIDTNGPGGVFCVRHTNQLMHDVDKLDKFINLLNGK